MAKRRSEVAAERNGTAVALEETPVALDETPVTEDPGFSSPGETKPAEKETPVKECLGPRCRSIDMPLGPPSTYAADHVEMRLKAHEAAALDRLWTGCQRENVYLSDGRRVNSRADVVRLMLERFAAYLEA